MPMASQNARPQQSVCLLLSPNWPYYLVPVVLVGNVSRRNEFNGGGDKLCHLLDQGRRGAASMI
jgi:hypothetical protein